jgi:hypothetical protein
MERSASRRSALTALAVALVLGALLRYHFSRPTLTDSEQLYRLVSQAQEAAEARNATGLTRLISDDYRDRQGFDKHQLTGMIVGWMRESQPFTVVAGVVGAPKIQGDRAEMQLKVRYSTGDPKGGPGDEFGMRVQLVKQRRGWKIVDAEGWEGEQEHLMGGD